MRNKDWIYALVLIILAIFLPRIMLFYVVCGILDFRRSNTFDAVNWKRYFFGNGLFTWILSPFNLLMDLFCIKNKKIYELEELPEECQTELTQLINTAKSKPQLIEELGKTMQEKNRGMTFFKWYGKNVDNSIIIPEFHQQFKYIKTIGISIFNKNQRTSVHYGPLRVTLRVLYNLTPIDSNEVYIQVAGNIHKWRDNPLFIFDDTLVHQSVNHSDQMRYVLFLDIARPSKHFKLMHKILAVIGVCIISINRVFYKNWDMIK
ncbi:MAG: hypothetical protein QG673_1322 [Pseudomonadota bacterium]|nr:hypothetical protein [Pseudomonadota bacterium]